MSEERMAILDAVERGELSVAEAQAALRRKAAPATETRSGEAERPDVIVEPQPIASPRSPVTETQVGGEEAPVLEASPVIGEAQPEASSYPVAEWSVVTRRERVMASGERLKGLNVHDMVGLPGVKETSPWPWPEAGWQWLYQDFDHPVWVDQRFDVAEGTTLSVVIYRGDLTLSGWEEPLLKVGAAGFDLRIGRDGGAIRIAHSTGQLRLWVPKAVSRISAQVVSGDIFLQGFSVQSVEVEGKSGDLRIEDIQGSLNARIDGGDVEVIGVNGDVEVHTRRGDIDVREVHGQHAGLRAEEGSVALAIGPVESGTYRCESDGEDVTLRLTEGTACTIEAEATDGGRIAPVTLPWRELTEWSAERLRGTLRGGGATITLRTKGGEVYIRERKEAR
jgi:hypothetical protein